jgi:hypothetical protein
MFKLMGFLSRKEGMSTEEFRAYYINKHAPLVVRTSARQLAYRRNFLSPVDETVNSHIDALGRIDFDVVTEMEFRDREHFLAWQASRSPADLEALKRDEREFLDVSRLRACVVDYIDVSY